MLSVKTALSTLCAGRLIDKLRCKNFLFLTYKSNVVKMYLMTICILLFNLLLIVNLVLKELLTNESMHLA